MKRKNKINEKSTTKINNFIVKMITKKSYKDFIEENTKGMYLFEKKEFIKQLDTILQEISRTLSKEVFGNVR